MDNVNCATFVALIMVAAAEIVIEKSGTCVLQKVTSPKKWAVASDLRNFLVNGFYRQDCKNIRVGNKLLGSSYFLTGNQDGSKV